MSTPATATAKTQTEAGRIFDVLRNGREEDRNQADRILSDPNYVVDRTELRNRLLDCLREDLKSDTLAPNDRAWLVYSLGRLAAGSGEAIEVIRKYLQPKPADRDNRWLRYWALAGLARGNDPQADTIAKEALAAIKSLTDKQQADERQVIMVATAILAGKSDGAALQRLREAIVSDDANVLWPALRALRVVRLHDQAILMQVIKLVGVGANSDITYDSIRALHHIDRDSPYAPQASRVLERFVEDWRTFPGRDAMRAQALIGIGKLRSPHSAYLLTEELLDSNPTIVREAAISLENILGAQRAAATVAQSAKGRAETWRSFALALHWMEGQKAVTDELAEMMSSNDIAQEETCRELLRSMGGNMAFEKLRAKSNLLANHQQWVAESEKRVNDLFEKTIVEAQKVFHWVTTMDRLVFALGMVLIITSAAMSITDTANFAKYVTAGGGVLSVLYSMFFSKPREKVEEAVDNLMKLKIVFLGYLHQLRQADQAYQRYMLEDKLTATDDVKRFQDMIAACMEQAATRIRTAAEKK